MRAAINNPLRFVKNQEKANNSLSYNFSAIKKLFKHQFHTRSFKAVSQKFYALEVFVFPPLKFSFSPCLYYFSPIKSALYLEKPSTFSVAICYCTLVENRTFWQETI